MECEKVVMTFRLFQRKSNQTTRSNLKCEFHRAVRNFIVIKVVKAIIVNAGIKMNYMLFLTIFQFMYFK